MFGFCLHPRLAGPVHSLGGLFRLLLPAGCSFWSSASNNSVIRSIRVGRIRLGT